MQIKKSTQILVLLFLSTALPLSANNIETGLSAWETAVEIYDEYSILRPYKMDVHSETYNRKGELEKTEELFYTLSYDQNGETESYLNQALEDGKDITEKKRKEQAKGSNRGGPGGPGGDMKGMDKLPFDPAVQNDVTAVDSGKTKYKNGVNCSIWDFTIKLNDKYTGVGTAWLNNKTGEAVSIDYSFEPLFPFVEKMRLNIDFTTNQNLWFLEKLRMEGSINMLILKKSFDSITSFSDYREFGVK